MFDVRRLQIIYSDHPTQWVGTVGECGSVYIRYRWGSLEAYIAENSRNAAADGVLVCEVRIGESYDGTLKTEEMKSLLSEHLNFV